MGWGDIADWIVDIGGNAWDKLTKGGDDYSGLISLLGGAAGASGMFGSSQQSAGYQGGIPDYIAMREQIPRPDDPNRRPGEAGRRYFTDTQFAQGSQPPQTMAQAQAIIDQQKQNLAGGGIVALRGGGYLDGPTDGMMDAVPAMIDGEEEAALSDGEFVFPADVVSGLGNGNSQAGAAQLEAMMERIRKARTGNPEQGQKINPAKYMPR